jgi:hypothetical protein
MANRRSDSDGHADHVRGRGGSDRSRARDRGCKPHIRNTPAAVGLSCPFCYIRRMVAFPRLNRATSALVLAGSAILFALITMHPAAAQTYDVASRDRLVREAVDLFRSLDRNPADIGRCTFERIWNDRPVSAETAQTYFGHTVRADLIVSDPPAMPAQIIDPANAQPELFCSQVERVEVRSQAIATFQNGRGSVLRFISISYGFPIFNANFTRAALVVQRSADSRLRKPDGTLMLTLEAQGGAEIFEKRGGRWQRIGYDSYYTAH